MGNRQWAKKRTLIHVLPLVELTTLISVNSAPALFFVWCLWVSLSPERIQHAHPKYKHTQTEHAHHYYTISHKRFTMGALKALTRTRFLCTLLRATARSNLCKAHPLSGPHALLADPTNTQNIHTHTRKTLAARQRRQRRRRCHRSHVHARNMYYMLWCGILYICTLSTQNAYAIILFVRSVAFVRIHRGRRAASMRVCVVCVPRVCLARSERVAVAWL